MKRVLIASAGLPSHNIGSWTNRFTKLLAKHPGVFDFILSPTQFPSQTSIFCEKRKGVLRILSKIVGESAVIYSCKNYINKLESLLNLHQSLHLVIIDDLSLLEGIALWKIKNNPENIKLDFSFHGHSFVLPEFWGYLVDSVFFLTNLGYIETIKRNEVFVPQIHIVGNGTDSNVFCPLPRVKKNALKIELGYREEDKILVWVSNNRPKKGLKLFLKLSKKLISKYENLHVLIIGASITESEMDSRIKSVGKIPNSELANFLQACDINCFTSLCKEGFGLTLIEAAKTGNIVLASQNGGIPEVLEDFEGAFLVKYPNQLDSWEDSFDQAWIKIKSYEPDIKFLREFHSLEMWETKFLKALES